MRAGWDDAAWHLLFECVDPNPWATITERDGPLWNEEVVEVFLDPVGDLQSYFEIEVNPLNTVCDLVLRRSPSGWRKEFGWHCDGLQTVVQRTPRGWNAALRIPFAAVTNDAMRAGTVWRVNFFRIDRPGSRLGDIVFDEDDAAVADCDICRWLVVADAYIANQQIHAHHSSMTRAAGG